MDMPWRGEEKKKKRKEERKKERKEGRKTECVCFVLLYDYPQWVL